jgi:hypothetical protein
VQEKRGHIEKMYLISHPREFFNRIGMQQKWPKKPLKHSAWPVLGILCCDLANVIGDWPQIAHSSTASITIGFSHVSSE